MVEVLDTRGVQEGSPPAEADTEATAEDSIKAVVASRCPDVILFCVQARQVDSAIGGDLDFAETALRAAQEAQDGLPGEAKVKIIPVLTQCDQLDPVDVRLSENDPDKMRHVHEATQVLTRHLRERHFLWDHLGSETVPVCASLYFHADGSPNPRRDYRWGIEELAVRIAEVIPDEAKLEFVRMARFRKVQERVAKRVVNLYAGCCGGIGTTPIPLADMPLITSLQILMIATVAYISGKEKSKEAVREFLAGVGANIGAGFVLRQAARGLVKLIPVAGNAVSGGVAAGSTKAIGNAAIRFYIHRESLESVRQQFRRRLKEVEAA